MISYKKGFCIIPNNWRVYNKLKMIVLGTGLSVITLLGFLSSNSNFMTSAGKYLEIIFLMVIICAFLLYVKLSPGKGQEIAYNSTGIRTTKDFVHRA
jgi:uncharacterized membrane protein